VREIGVDEQLKKHQPAPSNERHLRPFTPASATLHKVTIAISTDHIAIP
jgi:hypothetical protein